VRFLSPEERRIPTPACFGPDGPSAKKASASGRKEEKRPHPHVEPLEKVRPATFYMLTIDDVKEFPKYEKIWKEIFQVR
jgi:hypothetical protein